MQKKWNTFREEQTQVKTKTELAGWLKYGLIFSLPHEILIAWTQQESLAVIVTVNSVCLLEFDKRKFLVLAIVPTHNTELMY